MYNNWSTFISRFRTAWQRSFTSQKSRKGQSRLRPALELMEDRAVPAAGFFQGFELDSNGWVPPGGDGAVRVATGTGGIASQTGGFHALVTGAFTRWGGYTSTFPAGGYTTSIGIYLDMGTSANNDTRFDFSSAVSTPAGGHRRDFIFNAGFYNDTDVTGSGPRFVISASNNSPGWPKNPARDPLTITETGWYTFQHRFYDSGGGKLAVDLSIANSGGTVLRTWTLSDPTDIIGSTVGGNRYGWFANNQFSELAVDNAYQSSPSTVYVDDDWASLAVGTDPDGSGPANLLGFDAFSSIQDAIKAVADGGTVNVAAGTYNEAVSLNKTVTVLGAQAGVDARTRSGVPESIVSNVGGAFQISADNVTIDGFTISDSAGAGINIAPVASGYQVLNNVITNNSIGIYANSDGAALIEHNLFDANNNPGPAGGSAIYAENTSGLTIEANEFRNHAENGAVIFGAVSPTAHTNLTFKDNYVHENLSGVFALGINGGLFQGNTITGQDGGTGLTFGGADTNIDVLENALTDNLRGLRVQDLGYLGVTPNSDIEAHSNDFSGNSQYAVGIVGAGYTGGPLDAEGNWWGFNTAAGVAAQVSGNVDFVPFLITGVDTSAETGFQGDFSVAPGEGSVQVKVVGGRLMITGDKMDNLIRIEKGATANSYRVTGLAGTQINKKSGSFVFENVTRGIDASLRRGDDMLVLDGSASPDTEFGRIKVWSGRGDDLVRLQGVSVSGKSELGSAYGSDLVQVVDSTFSELAVDWRGNSAATSLELDNVTVTGQTAMRGGNGDNTVRAVNSNFGAAVVLNGGHGNDHLDAGTQGDLNTNGNTFAVDPVTPGFEDIMS